MKGQTRSMDVVLILALLVVLALVVGSIVPHGWLPWLPTSAGQTGVQEIPIPADKFVGGIAALSPGQALELFVSIPDGSGTPVPQTLTDLRVSALLGENTVLVAAPASSVATLQAALVDKDAKFPYHLVTGTPMPTSTPTATRAPVDVELPIPADKLIGGTGPLSVGQVVEMVASLPDDSGTPMPQTFTGIEVLALLDEGGEKGTVLVSAPPASVPALQAALVAENVKLTYRLLLGTPTPTITPTATPTATPSTPIPTPPSGQVHLEIDIATIDTHASPLVIGKAQLVIVERLESPLVVFEREGGGAATPVAVSARTATTYTVTVVAFLDESGIHYRDYNKDETKHVLIRLLADQLVDVARSLAGAESIWLVHNP